MKFLNAEATSARVADAFGARVEFVLPVARFVAIAHLKASAA